MPPLVETGGLISSGLKPRGGGAFGSGGGILPDRSTSRDASIAACICAGVGRLFGILADEAFDHLALALDGGAIERVPASCTSMVLLETFASAPRFEQRRDRRGAVRRRREDQRRLFPFGFARVDVGLGVGQQVDHVGAAGQRRQVHRRGAARIRLRVDVGAGLDQRLRHGGAAGLGGEVERRVEADARHRRHVGAGVDQDLGQFRVTALGGPVQRASCRRPAPRRRPTPCLISDVHRRPCRRAWRRRPAASVDCAAPNETVRSARRHELNTQQALHHVASPTALRRTVAGAALRDRLLAGAVAERLDVFHAEPVRRA